MLVMHSINVVRRNRRLQTCGDFHHYYSLEEPNFIQLDLRCGAVRCGVVWVKPRLETALLQAPCKRAVVE